LIFNVVSAATATFLELTSAQRDMSLKLKDLQNTCNKVDKTGSVKFTGETEEDKMTPFLDTLIVKKDNRRVKLLVYMKTTHTDQ